jgi:hypothetical protein
MNSLKNQFCIQVILVIFLIAMSSVRADYESGQQAWDAGRPADALIEWRAAADAGDSRAMLALGRLFVKGLGTPQNYIDAHMWFNLAASRGEIAAIAERDALEKKMTSANLAEAQKRASNWQPNKNQVAEAPEEAEQDASPPQPTEIREAQRLLSALGYKPGPADGIWGKRTGQAYQSFLRDQGLPLIDVLTVESLNALRNIAASQSGVGTPDEFELQTSSGIGGSGGSSGCPGANSLIERIEQIGADLSDPSVGVCLSARGAKQVFTEAISFYEGCPSADPSGEWLQYSRLMVAWVNERERQRCN